MAISKNSANLFGSSNLARQQNFNATRNNAKEVSTLVKAFVGEHDSALQARPGFSSR